MEKMSGIKMKIFWIILAILLVALVVFAVIMYINSGKRINVQGKIDDWKYERKAEEEGFWGGIMPQSLKSTAESFDSSVGRNIGFSTGGAKDVNNFRENIENGYFPISTDITYNGLFYDYTFDTGNKTESTELFSPSYSTAISKDPISQKNETYMTVGLNSNIKESDFSRKKLNLVVVLDISGSMSSSFNSYYYDQFTGKRNVKEDENKEDQNKSKMQIANEAVNILLDRLNDDDRFGMVLFDDASYLAKPISLVKDTDMDSIKNHILEIESMGGTNFEAGYTEGTELFNEYKNIDSSEYEKRIILITDAMPNYGETSKTGLLSYVKDNADQGIYTTFIGVGVDFNTELTQAISDVKGANYYSVHSSSQFKTRMGEEFEYMVTPLVFDLELNLNSNDYEIEKVYGSDTANKDNGNIMKVNTLFPSKTTSDGEVKGGVVLLKLKKKNENANGNLTLSVSYKDRNGKEYSNSQEVKFENMEEHYDNTGIRKAIVLTRYVNTIKNWILYERTGEQRFIILPQYGIMDCDYKEEEIYVMLGENERTSVNLKVSENYKNLFSIIKKYINDENAYIKDDTLNQEIKVLDKLIG